jgi:hypothetical protein
MTTTKTHLAISLGNGKINIHKSACGLGDSNKYGRFNYITKTLEFKNLYNNSGEDFICVKCLAKAKEQSRI